MKVIQRYRLIIWKIELKTFDEFIGDDGFPSAKN